MKSAGIVRRLDQLGRIVLPKSLRDRLKINNEDSLEFFTDNDRMVLRKYSISCIFCGNIDDVITFKGKKICQDCMKAMGEQ